jgi:RHS repeat-associated protein
MMQQQSVRDLAAGSPCGHRERVLARNHGVAIVAFAFVAFAFVALLPLAHPAQAQGGCGTYLPLGWSQEHGYYGCTGVNMYFVSCSGVISSPPNGNHSYGLCYLTSSVTHFVHPSYADNCRFSVESGCAHVAATTTNLSWSCGAGCAGATEACDGRNSSAAGEADAGSCGDDPVCENYRTDPVHVGSGAYLTHPSVDVRYVGAANPIEFVRRYTSMDGWYPPHLRARERARVGQGWFHTFDQSLYASDARSAPALPGAAGTQYVHRTAYGNGRRFTCAGDPQTGATCSVADGSMDVLRYDSTGAFWEIRSGAGVYTRFAADGELLSHGWFGTGGSLVDGWAVTRFATGSFAGHIDYVQDHLGRRLYFRWELFENYPHLARLEDATSAVLATFTRKSTSLLLETASSAAGSETYRYGSFTSGTITVSIPHLTAIERAGVQVLTVAYDDPVSGGIGPGRVLAIQASDGDYAFRYGGAAGNSCPNPSVTTMIIDRSTNLGVTCDPGAADPDAVCRAGGNATAVCDGGTCRAATCQEYAAVSGTTLVAQPVSISGNCSCGGTDELVWIDPGPDSPNRVARKVARDGTTTTYAYDPQGRMIAECVGDTDTEVTTDASSCPTTGVWRSRTYDTVFPSLVRLERRRSSVSSGAIAETEREYDPTSGRLRFVRRRGRTLDLDGTVLPPVEEVVEYRYDSSGRMQEILGPADERTVHSYWPAGSGTATGMLQYTDRYPTATQYLRTTHSSYTTTGRPQTVVEPSTVTLSYGYSFGGMRLASRAIAGRTTSFLYDTAGRLHQIVEPTSRRTVLTYDSRNRLLSQETFDGTASGERERILFGYDSAGRRTSLAAQRLNSTGALVVHTAHTWTATYEQHGFLATSDSGEQSPTSYTYDEQAMGYLEQVTRGDGNVETYDNDPLGRQVSIARTFATGVVGTHGLGYGNESGSNVNTGHRAPTRVVEPGGITRSYVYDDFGHLVRSSSGDWGTTAWRWQNGRMTQRRDGETLPITAVYTYDRLGRVTQINNDSTHPTMLGQDYLFAYDNGDGTIPCLTTPGCTYRRGELARVSIEAFPGTFIFMYYDYADDGSIRAERYPDGREARHDYTNGLLSRTYFPARTGDTVRYERAAVNNDRYDATEVMRIVGERSSADLVTWAANIQRDSLGRLAALNPAGGSTAPSSVSWRDDGRIQCWWVYRDQAGAPVGVVDRCYNFSADGSAIRHDSLVAADLPRSFLHDGGNRLTCATSSGNSTSCPTGAPLLERYAYDASDSRTELGSPAGTTSYVLAGNTIWDEYPPGRTIYYDYYYNDGSRRWADIEVTAGAPNNIREYVYDGDGRLSVMDIPRPTSTPSTTRQDHTISVLYDHRSRPWLILDNNTATGALSGWYHYYDLEDRLLNRTYYPDLEAAPGNKTVESFVHIEPLLVGVTRGIYINNALSSEQHGYYAVSPEGLPAAAYSFSLPPGSTTLEWRAQWSPFGTMLSETGNTAWRPPFRFRGQVELPRSDASWWNGSSLFTSRQGLVLNRWRTYDPRVGQYLQPEPMLVEGLLPTMHPYSYALLAPADYVDPDGREVITVTVAGVGVVEIIIIAGIAIVLSVIVYNTVDMVCENTRDEVDSEECVTNYINCLRRRGRGGVGSHWDVCDACMDRCDQTGLWPDRVSDRNLPGGGGTGVRGWSTCYPGIWE